MEFQHKIQHNDTIWFFVWFLFNKKANRVKARQMNFYFVDESLLISHIKKQFILFDQIFHIVESFSVTSLRHYMSIVSIQIPIVSN